MTRGIMQGCGWNFLVVCINGKIHDTRERNVTMRSDIWTKNIRSLGFWDIRELSDITEVDIIESRV